VLLLSSGCLHEVNHLRGHKFFLFLLWSTVCSEHPSSAAHSPLCGDLNYTEWKGVTHPIHLYMHVCVCGMCIFTKRTVKIPDFQPSWGPPLVGCGGSYNECHHTIIHITTALGHNFSHIGNLHSKFSEITTTKSTALESALKSGKKKCHASIARISWWTATGLLCSSNYSKGSQPYFYNALLSIWHVITTAF